MWFRGPKRVYDGLRQAARGRTQFHLGLELELPLQPDLFCGDNVCAQILALLESTADAELLCKSLAGETGYSLIVSKNFKHAISVLKSQRVDLVISDVHLENGGNVFEFLKWVRSNPGTSDTLFVLCSINPNYVARYVEDGLRLCARALGATKYIKMDRFQSEDFRKQIDALLPRGKRAIGDLLKEKQMITGTGE